MSKTKHSHSKKIVLPNVEDRKPAYKKKKLSQYSKYKEVDNKDVPDNRDDYQLMVHNVLT